VEAGALKDSYDDMNFTPPYLSTITARTLIIYGDRDPLYPVKIALEMYTAIHRSYLWIVPNRAISLFPAACMSFSSRQFCHSCAVSGNEDRARRRAKVVFQINNLFSSSSIANILMNS